ncbi:MAG: zinc ABC transporter substrate-binding protein [Rubrivivax sp.]|nr:zinc ABC transporter substrate-binding protein [Rubrivivax sp.]
MNRPVRDPARRQALAAASGWLALAATPVFVRAAPPERFSVVASFSILADIVRQVLPDAFEVTALVAADADAHVFSPRPSDAQRVAKADWVIINGLGFEGWITRLIRSSGYAGPVLAVTDGIRTRGHSKKGRDPHAWHSIDNAQHFVQRIAEAAQRRWPAQADAVGARAQAYRERLAEVDARLRTALESVPREQRRVITAHDAFGYLGQAYGIDFLSPQGWSTHSAPSAAAVGRLIRQIREQRIRAVFLENISDPRLMQRMAEEAGVRVGGTLYSDALSAAGGPADSYLKLMEHNVLTLRRALQAAG